MKRQILILLLLLSVQNSFAMQLCDAIIKKYQDQTPTLWGELVPGVKTRLATTEKILVLTLDACGSPSDGCDYRYLNFLKEEQIPATIFVSNRWIIRHPEDFKELIQCSLFDIENHGLTHVPCSMNGKSIYNIQGTKGVSDLINEVEGNAKIIQRLTGNKPKFYRSGTAYYDEIAVKVVNELGYEVLGFSVLGDAGATWDKERVKMALLDAKPGDIIILHMNKPEKNCADGAIEAIKELRKRGFVFVKLSQYPLM